VISKRVTELCLVESLYINCLLRKGRPALKKLQISNETVRLNKI